MASGNIITKIKYAFDPNTTYILQDSEAKQMMSKIPQTFYLGNCKNILCLKSGTTVKINWEDPGNLTTDDGGIIARQKRTILVRKQGSIPENISDGVTVVVSNVVNQYKVSPYTDTLPDQTNTYYYKLFPESTQSKITNDNTNAFSADELNWQTIHNLTEAGTISSYFELGDILTTKHDDYGDIELQIVDFDHPYTFADGQEHHSITFLNRYGLQLCQFDAIENQYGITDDTTWSSFKYLKRSIESSNIYFVLDDDSKITSDRKWTSSNSAYQLLYETDRWKIKRLTDNATYDQQSSATSPSSDPWDNSVTWKSSTSTTINKWKKYYTLSNDVYTQYTDFTDGETISGNTYYQQIPDIIFGLTNNGRSKWGYNRWSQSGIRQYLNSDKLSGTYYVKQSPFDVQSLQMSQNGFIYGFQQNNFIKNITSVVRSVIKNQSYDGRRI